MIMLVMTTFSVFLFRGGLMRVLSMRGKPGISLAELLVEVALLSIVSVAALQMMGVTESTLVGSQTKLNEQQRSEAISSFIYKDFARHALNDKVISQTYRNSDMPDDLQNSGSVTVATLFGNLDRYREGDPLCPLLADIDLESGTFTMEAGCVRPGGRPVAQLMNDLIAKGIVLTTGFQDGIGRCSISERIAINSGTGIATIRVDDKTCLGRGSDPKRGLPKGKQVLLPRFVAYDTEAPKTFFTSMIGSPDIATPDVGLEMPENYTVIGGGVPNATNIVNAFLDDPSRLITVSLATKENDAKLSVKAAPSVKLAGVNTSKLKLTGTSTDVRAALESLEYRSPAGFMSEDMLTGRLQAGSTIADDKTKLLVRVNCGGQTCGTALMFEIGKTDAAGVFQRTRYITSVSKCGTELPSTYYGYCGTSFRFDQIDGSPNWYPRTGNDIHFNYCSVAGKLLPYDYNQSLASNIAANKSQLYPKDVPPHGKKGQPMLETQKFPYITYSPRFRPYQKQDYVTVFLYEQDQTPLSASEESIRKSLTENRYSLFFQFDTFDKSGGNVTFELSNIEKGRVMSDLYDPFTFLDDTSEYFPKVPGNRRVADGAGSFRTLYDKITRIGSDGRLSTKVKWTKPNDGVVVPLKLDRSAYDPSTLKYELKHYNQGRDLSGSRNPKLSLQSWSGLNGWNIRSTKVTRTPTGFVSEVAWQTFDFNNGLPDQQTDFQLVVSKAQRCPTPVPDGFTVRTPPSGTDPDGASPDPDGASPDPDGASPDPDGASPDPDGASPDPDGASPDPEGTSPDPEGEGGG